MMKIVILCMIYGLLCFGSGVLLGWRLSDHKLKTMRKEAGLDMHPKDDRDPLKDWNELFNDNDTTERGNYNEK